MPDWRRQTETVAIADAALDGIAVLEEIPISPWNVVVGMINKNLQLRMREIVLSFDGTI